MQCKYKTRTLVSMVIFSSMYLSFEVQVISRANTRACHNNGLA